MKRNPRVLFLCLLASILFAPWLHAQPISKYPLGMYIYHNNGIYINSGNLNVYKNPANPTQNIMEYWRQNLNMNFFNTQEGCSEYLWYLNTGYSNYIKSGDIKYVYRTGLVINRAEGHYLKFNYANAAKNGIIFTPGAPFEIYQTGGNYRVYSPNDIALTKTNAVALPPPPTKNDGYIIDNLNIIGSNNNKHVIRPRGLNTNYTTRLAAFHVRVGIKNSTANNTVLMLKMTNGNPNQYDSNNNGTFTKNATLTSGSSIQYVILDFTLNIGPEGSTYYSAYAYAPKFSISCSMDFGKSFDIESITLYDDTGLSVVEGNYLSDATFNSFVNSINNPVPLDPNFEQIVEIFDEPTIGNFQPAKYIADYMRNNLRAGKVSIFSTGVEADDINRDAMRKRLFDEVGPGYYADNPYPFGWGESETLYSTYISNIIGETHNRLKSNSDFLAGYVQTNPQCSTKLIAVPQIFSETNRWRPPTKNEILASSYVTLLNGYKGILYWVGGPVQDIPNNIGLYPYLNPTQYPHDGPAFNNYMFNSSNMVAYKKDAINKVASFLNYRSNANSGNRIIGDLLYSGVFKEAQIIGNGSNYTDNLTLGDLTRSQVIRADVFDLSTGDVATGTNLIGVNYFTIPGDDNNTSYYLITNLNQDGHSCRVRLFFNSYNSKDFLNIYTLNDPTQLDGRAYPKNGVVLFTLPADGAMVLKVVNSDENLLYGGGFPKGVRFGAAYTAPGTSTASIYFDNNFFSPDNDISYSVAAPVEVISLNNGSYTDFATFRVLTFSYNGTTNMQIEFTKYLQQTNNTFTAQTPVTYVVPRPSAASAVYKVGAMSYDSDNNGIDELGYYVSYNNRYFIYSFNGTGFTQRKIFPGSTPSTTPEYFSLNATVLGAKWNGSPTIYIYNPDNYNFYFDKDIDLQINLTTEKQPMGTWFANGWGPIPFTGDWYGDANYDYGVFEWNNYYKNTIFECNFSGTDGYSYFEFPYAMHNSKPIVWKPRNLSIAKTGFETGEEQAVEIPSEYSISQNFPNPFNPATTIRFALPAESRVTLDVFNILGERVAELVNDVRPAGTMDVRFDGSNLASGIYIYKFNATSLENGKHFQKINKMMLLK